MRALLVLPLLLCAVLCLVQVRAEMTAMKLCGREFLRAVVYTCGGSRWRRVLTEPDMDASAVGVWADGALANMLTAVHARYAPGLSTGEQSSLESLSSSSFASQLSRRDSNMLTTVCCQVGCRKSDLTFLC